MSSAYGGRQCRSPLATMSRSINSVARHLIQHVIQKWQAGLELAFAGAIQIDADGDLGFQGVAGNGGLSR